MCQHVSEGIVILHTALHHPLQHQRIEKRVWLHCVLCTLLALNWTPPCVCRAELQDMHQTAQSDAKESREELDSLSNLIGRLDFNDFFKPKPDYRAMLAQGAI